MFKSIIVLLSLLLTSCGEMGSDAKGPFKGYLTLISTDGVIKDFYLGGHNSFEKCIDQLEFEVVTYERDQGRKFYTNIDENYGGHKSEKNSVEHLIIGANCVDESED